MSYALALRTAVMGSYVTVVREGVSSANRPLHDGALTLKGASHDMPAAEELAALWAEVPASK